MEEKHLLVDISQKALIEVDGQVLLIHGTDEWWEMPGGRVNEGDGDLNTALQRELMEELSLKIEVKDLCTAYLHTGRNGKDHIILVYRCKLVASLDQLKMQESEVQGWKLFSRQQIQSLEHIAGNSIKGLEKYIG